MPELGEWGSFYMIVGSAAGALIGLQFVVMTLIAARPPVRGMDVAAAFATPTIVHFSAVLFLSAMLCVPWHALAPIAGLWGLGALIGLAYVVVVAWRMRTQTVYKPGFEDWLFHAVLPLAAYVTLALSALSAPTHLHAALFGIGSVALLLLFIGIHNAWDAVVYQVMVYKSDREPEA